MSDTVFQLLGGLPVYIGCGRQGHSTLYRYQPLHWITAAGVRESHPHNVQITKKPRIIRYNGI